MLYDLLLKPYESYTILFIILEALAAVFGIVSVWYARKNSILVYPTGIVSTALYVFLLFRWGVYGDAVINLYYTAMSVYGWWVWSHHSTEEQSMPISEMRKRSWIFVGGFTMINFVIFYLILSRFTDSTVPLLDSITTAVAFSAMYLMARKKLESWLFWIACNVISIGLYIYKGYGLTALQYLIFLILAVSAYHEWKKILRSQDKCSK